MQFQLLSFIFDYFATRQHWQDSDKAGGVLHFLVPMAEGTIAHVVAQPTPAPTTVSGETQAADGSTIIHLLTHQTMAAAIEAAANFKGA